MGRMKEEFMRQREDESSKDKYIDDDYLYDRWLKTKSGVRQVTITGAIKPITKTNQS